MERFDSIWSKAISGLFIIFLCSMLACTGQGERISFASHWNLGSGVAADPVPGDRTRMLRNAASLIGPNSTQTAIPCTWEIQDEEPGRSYIFVASIDDGYLPDGSLDRMYVSEVFTGTTCSYTFYETGAWRISVYLIDPDAVPMDLNSAIINENKIAELWIYVTDGGENAMTRAVTAAANACQAASTWKTVENIHDWLMDHCEYDSSMRRYSVDALFLEGIGVCNSYARAFVLICNELDIPCRWVGGMIGKDARHAWNAVQVDGKWTLIDVTWDDQGRNFFSRHAYCGMTDEDMNMSRLPITYVPGAVVSDDPDCHYFLREDRWKSYAAPFLQRLGECINANLYDFRMNSGEDNPPYLLNGESLGNAYMYYWGKILQRGLNRENEMTRSNGRTYTAHFEYEYDIASEMYEPWIWCRLDSHGTLSFPDSTQTIETESLRGSAANHVLLPESCTRIGANAFADMDLWSITIPGEHTVIDESAFGEIPNLTIIAEEGSDAAAFAETHGYMLKLMDGTN